MTEPTPEERFKAMLEVWREEHPDWTIREQIAAFSPTRLYYDHAGQDGELYVRLMEIAGYLVHRTRPEGEDIFGHRRR